MKLEMCTSTEWWRNLLDLDDVDDAWHDEAADEFAGMYRIALEAAGHEVESAHNGRSLCQAWAGAKFRQKGFGVGTFDEVSDEKWATVDALFEETQDRWEVVVRNRWPVEGEPGDGFTTDGCVPYSPPESRIARPCGDEPKT